MSQDPPTREIPLPLTGSIPLAVDTPDVSATKPPSRLWWILMVSAGGILTAMTFPGQTAGLSPFTDPLLENLAIDRTAISLSYLIATLAGAATMPFLAG